MITATATCEVPRDSPADICQYITDHCHENFQIAKFYYCLAAPNTWTHLFTVVGLLLVLAVLFFTIGMISSNYLSPLLQYMTNYLQIDEKIAGLTLLSFGNGSTDLFSTFQAMSQDSTSLAIGELVGSSFFLVSFVIGLMAAFKPFKVNRIDFLTDLVFFSLLITIAFFFIQDGVLKIWECLMMCILYIAYLGYIIAFGTSTDPINDLQILDQNQDLSTHPILIITKSSIAILDSNDFDQHYLSNLRAFLQKNVDADPSESIMKFHQREEQVPLLNDLHILNDLSSTSAQDRVPISFDKFLLECLHFSSERTGIGFIYTWSSVAVNLVLAATIPVIPLAATSEVQFVQLQSREQIPDKIKEFRIKTQDHQSQVDHHIRLFQRFQIFLIPFLFQHLTHLPYLYSAFASVILALIDLAIAKVLRKSTYLFLISLIGFVTVLNYITLITAAIVTILKNLGLILHINESFLGLTVLSLGNSIGDLIANLTLSRLGLHITGLNACLGAPLLYILLGIGVNGLLIMWKHGDTQIEFAISANLKISSFGLFAVLAYYLILVPKNNWTMGYKTGLVAVSWWWLINIINVVLEL